MSKVLALPDPEHVTPAASESQAESFLSSPGRGRGRGGAVGFPFTSVYICLFPIRLQTEKEPGSLSIHFGAVRAWVCPVALSVTS